MFSASTFSCLFNGQPCIGKQQVNEKHFKNELEVLRLVSGLSNFPTLMGRTTIHGVPSMVVAMLGESLKDYQLVEHRAKFSLETCITIGI